MTSLTYQPIRRASDTQRVRHASHGWLRHLFSRPASPPRRLPTGPQLLGKADKLEEENWDWYSGHTFYPVRIGQTFQSRYQVLGKLGYGAHSTAWLCRDLCAHQYLTLKVCEVDSPSARREVAAYQLLKALTTAHSGALLIRQLLDVFELKGTGGVHLCLVHETLGMSIETLRELMPGEHLSEALLTAVLKHLFRALDFLQSEAKMIHTDLHARNTHLRLEDDAVLRAFEKSESSNPSPRKVDGERVIYESRGLRLPKRSGRPILCDFGEARHGEPSYSDDIQPYVYRAPEVILDIPWSYEVDIWNVGTMIWDMFENKHLFSARGSNGNQFSEYHLAEMVAILDPPTMEYLQRTETSWKYFDIEGKWKASAQIPDLTLEKSERRLEGNNKVLFLDFMRKMLHWMPEKRYTARQLLEHPWLNG